MYSAPSPAIMHDHVMANTHSRTSASVMPAIREMASIMTEAEKLYST